jgi:hypothetical protein
MFTRISFLSLSAVAIAFPNPAAAWHKDGHMAVAWFAWQQLGDKEKAQAQKILTAHPHYDLYLTKELPNNMIVGEWAFVRAATWPDWVRDPRGPDVDNELNVKIKSLYNKPDWHFVNLPYVHPKDVDKFDADAIRKSVLEPELDEKGEPRHALAALKKCMEILQAQESDPSEKAIKLCWLLHLVGDLHQPLHCSALIATKESIGEFNPPHGDKGGNALAIMPNPDAPAPIVLHFYWDALLFSKEPSFKTVDVVVNGWRNKFKRESLPELKTTDRLAWANESLDLAKNTAYRAGDKFLPATPIPKHAKEKKDGLVEGIDAPVLPPSYNEAAERIAARQMALAGFRLADQLIAAFKNGG